MQNYSEASDEEKLFYDIFLVISQKIS